MQPASKRQRTLSDPAPAPPPPALDDAESTDFKLAILSSLHPDRTPDVLLDYLLAYDGSVEAAGSALSGNAQQPAVSSPRKRHAANGYQSSLATFAGAKDAVKNASTSERPLTKKGRTLHLYSPEDVEKHTPCSIVHNFLSKEDAEACIRELIAEMPTFHRGKFMMFDREVESPHTFRFYVDDYDKMEEQKTEYSYNGGPVTDVGKTPPQMMKISPMVQAKVNEEINRRMRHFQPGGKKLRFQSLDQWEPNASFVNCYDGGKENVGYHSDEGTYLGCRPVIGSLSLGVTREFRVRKIVPQVNPSSADEQGQVAIHLPHNSLLIMHAEMQEEWKHSIAPALAIDPHPLAGNKRFNITYRCFKDYLHPKFTPRCKCNIPCILRCVQKRAATRGRYMWMCHAGFSPEKRKSCSHFEWAEFDEDGKPPWWEGYKGNVNLPSAELTDKSGAATPDDEND